MKENGQEGSYILNEVTGEHPKSSSSSLLLTVFGVSVVVLGVAFFARKYDKLPDIPSAKLPAWFSSRLSH